MQRFVRFMVYRPYFESRGLRSAPAPDERDSGGRRRPLGRHGVHPTGPPGTAQGHIVCIFPEGEISRTGNLLPFKRGLEKIVEGLDVPIVPVYLDGVWGSLFSFEHGRSSGNACGACRNRVTALFG